MVVHNKSEEIEQMPQRHTSSMEYLTVASLVPIAGSLLYLQSNGWPLLSTFLHLVEQIPHCLWSLLTSFGWHLLHDRNFCLLMLLAFRYHRIVVHSFAYFFLYKPDEIPSEPTVTEKNVHVILPTVDPENIAFDKCINSILAHSPKWLTVVCGGAQHVPKARNAIDKLSPGFSTNINVAHIDEAHKRKQILSVLDTLAADKKGNKDTILVFCDDHAWWEGENYLKHLLAPFENEKVGLVGTKKRVLRDPQDNSLKSCVNFIACLYLERHNFEITATNAIDNGCFVLSARTCAVRANIVMDSRFRNGFVDDRFFFNRFGPLNCDDDNFITRWVTKHDYKLKFQNDDDSENMMGCTIGIDGYDKFSKQLLRWARSQWRSNITSLFRDGVLRRQCWTPWAMFIYTCFNFALVWDVVIILAWYFSSFEDFYWYRLTALMLGARLVKLAGFFWRHPRDLPKFFLVYLPFTWYHSWIKFYALLTFWNAEWSGRKLEPASDIAPHNADDGDDDRKGKPRRESTPLEQRLSPIPDRSPAPSPSLRRSRRLSTPRVDRAELGTSSANTTEDSFADPWRTTPRSSYNSPAVESVNDSEHSVSPSPSRFTRSQSKTPQLNHGKFKSVLEPSQMAVSYSRDTPWGKVNTTVPHLLPVNIRESQSRSRSRSPQPFVGLRKEKPKNHTFRVPSVTSSSSQSTAASTPVAVQYPTPEASPRRESAAAQELPRGRRFSQLSTPPLVPFPMDLRRRSYHSYDRKLEHEVDEKRAVSQPTNFSKSMPPVPEIGVKIHFKKDASPFRATKREEYHRDFVRGGDCHRVHADGKYLTPPRPSLNGGKRCISPERVADPVVSEHPQW